MSNVFWISILTLSLKVWCLCSGDTTSLSVGYTANTVKSPNYDNGYSPSLRCSWLHSTTITGAVLFVQVNGSIDCTGDDLTIYDGTDSTGSILHICTDTNDSPPSNMIASTGSIYTSFITDATSKSEEKGFVYNVISAKDLSGTACSDPSTPMVIMASTAVKYISSPNFPGEYPGYTKCFWRIEKKLSEKVELSFKFIDIEYVSLCRFDYIKITDDETGTTVLTSCGENVWYPTQTYTTTGNLTIEFSSDASNDRRGFLLAYSVLGSPESPSEDESSCFYDNCVILPVSIAVGGIVVIIIIATIILCCTTKAFAAKNSTRPLAESRVPTIQGLIFPKSRSRSRIIGQASYSSKDLFASKSQHIISQPPIATQSVTNISPRLQRATERLNQSMSIDRSLFSQEDESISNAKKNISGRTNYNMQISLEEV